MRKILALSIILFYCSAFLFSQNDNCRDIRNQLQELAEQAKKLDHELLQTKLDSLDKFISNDCNFARAESKIVSGFIAIGEGELDQALIYFDHAIDFSGHAVSYRKKIASHKAEIHLRKEQNQIGLEAIDVALGIPCPEDSISCHRLDAFLHTDRALFLKSLGRTEEALESYHKIEEIFERYGIVDSLVQASIYSSMGNLYDGEFSDYRQSLNYYKKTINFLPKEHMGRFLMQNNMGFRYKSLGKLDSARLTFNKTINGTSNSRYMITAYQGLGALANGEKDYPNGIKYYGLALESAIKSKKSRSIYKSRIYLAKSYYLNGDFQNAQEYLQAAIDSRKNSEATSKYNAERDMYSHLIELGLTDKKLSYNIYQDFLNYDTLVQEQRTKIMDKSVSKYEKRLLKDSLDRVVLLQSFEEQKAKNYKLGTLASVLGLILTSLLAFQFKNRFLKQKEVNEELVFQNNELQRLNEQLEQKTVALSAISKVDTESKEVSLKTKDKTYFIPTDNITYVQAEDDGTRVYYDDISKWTDVSLKNFHQDLGDISFVQIAKGIVVNVKHIAWINTNTLKMRAGAELKIGRVYKPKIKKVLES